MGTLSIVNSDHVIFESGITARRRSRNILHDRISANPQPHAQEDIHSLIISYKVRTKMNLQVLWAKIIFTSSRRLIKIVASPKYVGKTKKKAYNVMLCHIFFI
jgi:hypothetical protein